MVSRRDRASEPMAACCTSSMRASTVCPLSSEEPRAWRTGSRSWPNLLQRRSLGVHRLTEAAHGLVELFLHLGLVELRQELLALGQLLLQGQRVLLNRGAGLISGLGRLKAEGLQVVDLILGGDEAVGERFGRLVVLPGLAGVAPLGGVLGHTRAWRVEPLTFPSSSMARLSCISCCFWLATTFAACSTSRRCCSWASAMACSSWIFGSALASKRLSVLAVKYRQRFLPHPSFPWTNATTRLAVTAVRVARNQAAGSPARRRPESPSRGGPAGSSAPADLRRRESPGRLARAPRAGWRYRRAGHRGNRWRRRPSPPWRCRSAPGPVRPVGLRPRPGGP